MIRLLLAILEAARLYWDLLPKARDNGVPTALVPPREYMTWRLGTVYGIYPRHRILESPNTYADLIRLAWQDRAQILRFLLWRRDMRISARRKRLPFSR